MPAHRFPISLVALLIAASMVVWHSESPTSSNIIHDLERYNDGPVEVRLSADPAVANLLVEMQGVLCALEFHPHTYCPLLNASLPGDGPSQVSTYVLDGYAEGTPFHAMVSLHPLHNEEIQLWQVVFLHFPTGDEMYEVRLYADPKSPDEPIILWKEDLKSTLYYQYTPKEKKHRNR